MGSGLLHNFCGSVKARMRAVGFDWQTLIDALLPVVMELLQSCFNQAADLDAFARGKRGPLQLARLRLKCRQIVQEQGVRGVIRIANAAGDLQAAILAELDDRASKAAGPSLWQEALDEASSAS